MQTDPISRLQSMSSVVKIPSPLSGKQQLPHQQQGQHHSQHQGVNSAASDSHPHNLGQLDNIFQSVKRQIDQWGENAKWKIDLVLLDNPQQQQTSSLHPLLSPQHLHPNAITTPSNGHAAIVNGGDSLPITSSIQYPWDYVAPSTNEWKQDSDDLQQKLRESTERQKYLESIIWSQAEQIKHTSVPQENAINTMKNIFLMAQNEQKVHYLVESDLLQKDVEALSKKLKKISSILERIEKMELSPDVSDLDKEALLNDRTLLMRKLHLAELRLTARDTEIDYLHEVIDTLKTNAANQAVASPKPFQQKLRKGPPYLFQQQYSPRSSEVRSADHHPLSGLDSLGIVADQMLSDPEFESTSSNAPTGSEKRLRSRLNDRRSQRSIDSAATLLAMPQLMIPQRMARVAEEHLSSSPSPEQQKPHTFDHIPKKPRSTYTRWTEAEDRLLRAAVKKYGHSNWEACSKDVHGRSNIQCRNRWIRHLEHKPVPIEENEEHDAEQNKQKQAKQQQVKQQQAPKSHQLHQQQPTQKSHQLHLSHQPQRTQQAHQPHQSQTSPTINRNARQSPSIAALLNNSNEDNIYQYSPQSTPQQAYAGESSTSSSQVPPASVSSNQGASYLHPAYRPPSPMQTPKNGKRRSPEDIY